MTARKLAYLVWSNLSERKGRTASAVFVIAFAMAVVLFILALSLGFLRGVVQKAEEAYPPGMLVVKPKMVNVAMLSVAAKPITDEITTAVRALRGIEYVAPQLSLRMPMRAEAEVLGQAAESDAFVLGVDPVIVGTDVDKRFKFQYQPDDTKPVPCVVPRYFLDMYNLAYSESMGLPKVNEHFAIGKHVKLYLGESYTMGDASAKKKEVTLQIVGLTPNPNFVGVLIPLRNAMGFNEWYTGKKDKSYSALHVKLSDVNALADVTASIEKMELMVQSQKETFEKFQFVARALGVLTGLFGIIVVLISAISVFNTFSLIMSQRRGEVGLLRAVGATRRTVSTVYVAEVAAIGLLGGAIGIAASVIILKIADKQIVARLPKVTFMPDHLFDTSTPVVLACLLGGLLLSIIATLPIILRTTHTPPVNLITE